MIPRLHSAAALLLAAVLGGCGYVGSPLPPALNIPVAITDLVVEQRSGRIEIRFTPSLKSTDDLILKSLSAIELRAGENPDAPVFDIHRWAAAARKIDVPAVSAGPVEIELPVAGWEEKDIIFAVRSIGPGGRPGEWSPPVSLRVVEPPQAPAGLTAEAAPGGVLLRWQPGGGGSVRVYRKSGDEKEEAAIGASTEGTQFLDAGAVFGTEHIYRLQRVIDTGGREAVSEFSPPVSIKPVDIFAPAVPVGLIVQAGIGAVELAWDRNGEPDLRGYQVWRAEGQGQLARLSEPVGTASFTDKSVKPGVRYRYAVSSLDQAGNESKPCHDVEVLYQ